MKLGVFFFGDRTELTGAGAVVRSFADNTDVFAANGIDCVRMYDLTVSKSQSPNAPQKGSSQVKKYITKLLSKSAFGANFLIRKLYFDKGKQVVDSYFNNEVQDEDILIFHEMFTCVAYVEKCTREKNDIKKFVLVLHTNGEVFKMLRAYYPPFAHSHFEKEMERRVNYAFEKAQKIIFVSQLSCNHFCKTYPNYKEKAVVVYNGISRSFIDYKPVFDGIVRMITVGTVNSRKNQRLLVETIAHLNRNDIFLTIVGGGDKLEECKQKAISLGVEKYVNFLGPRKDVETILKDFNLFVMSSFDEGLPISAIEALRAKLPLILTDVGGNKELIDKNGYLVTPDLGSMTNMINLFANDVETQKRMSEQSFKIFIERFVVETMVANYSRIFKEIIS